MNEREEALRLFENSVTIEIRVAEKVPEHTFMRWLRSQISKGRIDINFHYIDSRKNKWLRDSLSSQIGNWNCSTPVFISAQTGTGKNTFVRKNLLTKVYNDNVRNRLNKRILLLSNRVALNRQSKLQYAEYIREFTGDSSYIRKFKEYTVEGIDRYIDFGVITICSYHQLYERKLLDSNEYEYIICDECHFFTSDAIFNIETDKILEYIVTKGKKSVRIYMTATIETVFEAIVREEFEYLRNRVNDLFLDLDKYSNSVDYRISIMNKELIKILNPCEDGKAIRCYTISEGKNRILETMLKKFHFYYMSRNYDYIKNVYVYKNHEELAGVINISADKWLVFVNELPKNNDEDPLNELKRKVIQLSREEKYNNKKARETYDKLIEKESFDYDVLITTSLLNNGINVNDEKVKNIVIDVFDRTEFIQMLGRVRVKSGSSINLYIREYTNEELKKLLERYISRLVLMLYIDTLDGFSRLKFYEYLQKSPDMRSYKVGDLFRLEDSEKKVDYNKNAVLQIIDSASRIFNLIRKTEENYVVKLNINVQDLLIKVREYYIYGDGRNKSWSRNIVDLLETEEGLDNRNKCIYEEKRAYFGRDSLIEEKYSFKFNDDFIRYLYSEMILKYFDNNVASIIEKIKTNDNWKKYQLSFNNLVGDRHLSHIEEFEIIKKIFRESIALNISVIGEEDINKIIQYYIKLANTNTSTSLDEQIIWIEKCDCFLHPLGELNNSIQLENNSDFLKCNDNMKTNIIKLLIDEKVYEANVVPSKNNIVKCELPFLLKYGIKNDDNKVEWIRNNCLNNITKNTLKDCSFSLEGVLVKIMSVQCKSDNKTYYLLVKQEQNGNMPI